MTLPTSVRRVVFTASPRDAEMLATNAASAAVIDEMALVNTEAISSDSTMEGGTVAAAAVEAADAAGLGGGALLLLLLLPTDTTIAADGNGNCAPICD